MTKFSLDTSTTDEVPDAPAYRVLPACAARERSCDLYAPGHQIALPPPGPTPSARRSRSVAGRAPSTAPRLILVLEDDSELRWRHHDPVRLRRMLDLRAEQAGGLPRASTPCAWVPTGSTARPRRDDWQDCRLDDRPPAGVTAGTSRRGPRPGGRPQVARPPALGARRGAARRGRPRHLARRAGRDRDEPARRGLPHRPGAGDAGAATTRPSWRRSTRRGGAAHCEVYVDITTVPVLARRRHGHRGRPRPRRRPRLDRPGLGRRRGRVRRRTGCARLPRRPGPAGAVTSCEAVRAAVATGRPPYDGAAAGLARAAWTAVGLETR